MKRILSLMLAVVLCLGALVALSSCANAPEGKVTVVITNADGVVYTREATVSLLCVRDVLEEMSLIAEGRIGAPITSVDIAGCEGTPTITLNGEAATVGTLVTDGAKIELNFKK